MPGAVGVPPTGPASRVAAHMDLLLLAHPMVGQIGPQMADGNALTLFNDISYDIPEMSSNISGFLVTIACCVPGVLCLHDGTIVKIFVVTVLYVVLDRVKVSYTLYTQT